MMYPYMSFNDHTEVTHSQIQSDGSVKVYIETPVYGGFKSLTCVLPDYRYQNDGYSEAELKTWLQYIRNNAHVIIELAGAGGFQHAAAVAV